jgi:Flp pilus assembly protein TadG
VEFALLLVLFLGVLAATLDTAIMYFAAAGLDASVRSASRLIRTGQVQTSGMTAAAFKSRICSGVAGAFYCEKELYVRVSVVSAFADVDLSTPITGGKLSATSVYNPGNAGDIVVVQAYLPWDPIFNDLAYATPVLSDGRTLIASAAVFRNEPFN